MSSEVVEIQRRGPRLFVSYSFDNVHAMSFAAALIDNGFRPTLVDDRSLLGKRSLTEAIAELIEACDYTVPLIDEGARDSEWVRREIEISLDRGVPIVPVLHPGIEPIGALADIPCLIGIDANALAARILQDFACLSFDHRRPPCLQPEPLIGFMGAEQTVIVDPDLGLGNSIADVVRAVIEIGHDGATKQVLDYWRRFQEALQRLEDVAGAYRAALWTFLEGWSEPAKRSLESWDALARLVVGREFMRLAEMFPPHRNEAWGRLREGATEARVEWDLIEEPDPLRHLWLWGLGQRTLPRADWDKDPKSPLGDWILVSAVTHDRQRHTMILADEPNLAVGLRLREPPSRYLESWHWIDYVLPQMADNGTPLDADLGTDMLLLLEPA